MENVNDKNRFSGKYEVLCIRNCKIDFKVWPEWNVQLCDQTIQFQQENPYVNECALDARITYSMFIL